MREKTCCFTGHRDIPENERERLAIRLDGELRELIDLGYRYFGAGGALGFDTIAAQAVLRLREDYPHIRLILVLPCTDQASRWSREDQMVYEDIKRRADKVVCPNRPYFSGCMHQRNRYLVDYSSLCLCYLSKPKGGTAYTVDYARKMGLKIINVAQ